MFAVFGPGTATRPMDPPVPPQGGPRTALRVTGGHPHHLAAHLDRLKRGAEALGAAAPWVDGLESALRAWLEAATGDDRVLRLWLHGPEGLVSARLEPLPVTPAPYRLVVQPHPMGDLRGNALARHKGLSGPWRQPVLAEARKRGCDDAHLIWPDQTVAETAIAAIAVEEAGTLVLPPFEGRVASLAEALDLPAWAAERGLSLITETLPLVRASKGSLWCLNAVRGVWPAILL